MEKLPTLQYCLVAKISYEPRHSSGRWCQSIRRPLWSRWLKYSVGTRIERKQNHIEKKRKCDLIILPSVAASQKQQIKRFPPSINCMNEHIYALQRWHRTGPISPKLVMGGSS
jgi:hypothetical protein